MMQHSETMSKSKIYLSSFYIDDVSGSAVAVRDAISTAEGVTGYSNGCGQQTCYGK